jgi:hypothetical protein
LTLNPLNPPFIYLFFIYAPDNPTYTLHRPLDQDELVAYVSGIAGVPKIKEAISNSLPHYMVPTTFVMLGSLPHLPNGKVNKHGLPEPTCVPADQRHRSTAW